MSARASMAQDVAFYWLPVDGARHAIVGVLGSHQPDTSVNTLCDMTVRARAATE